MIDKEKLNQMVEDIFPVEYKPPPKGSAPGFTASVTNVGAMADENFERHLKSFGGIKEPKQVKAATICWGEIKLMAGVFPKPEEMNSHSIWLRKSWDPNAINLAFVLLHEVGHVDWNIRREELTTWEDKEKELYCDLYAHDKLKEIYGFKTAFEAVRQYGCEFKTFAKQFER